MPTNDDHTYKQRRVRVVHTPTVESRTIAYLGEHLPFRLQAIRDQINAQRTVLGQATGDAVRLAKPENTHLAIEGCGPHYLAAVAANAAMVVSTLRNSARELLYQATLAGYDTSSMAPIARDIEAFTQDITAQYQAFAALWHGGHPSPEQEQP